MTKEWIRYYFGEDKVVAPVHWKLRTVLMSCTCFLCIRRNMDKPLSRQKFKALKLILQTKGHSTSDKVWLSLPYSHYLKVRQAIVACKGNTGACCVENPSHKVFAIWSGGDVSVTEDISTGDLVEYDCSGDVDAVCQSNKNHDVMYMSTLDSYESLVRED